MPIRRVLLSGPCSFSCLCLGMHASLRLSHFSGQSTVVYCMLICTFWSAGGQPTLPQVSAPVISLWVSLPVSTQNTGFGGTWLLSQLAGGGYAGWRVWTPISFLVSIVFPISSPCPCRFLIPSTLKQSPSQPVVSSDNPSP